MAWWAGEMRGECASSSASSSLKARLRALVGAEEEDWVCRNNALDSERASVQVTTESSGLDGKGKEFMS